VGLGFYFIMLVILSAMTRKSGAARVHPLAT
jgi:hypothetical protein